MLPIVPAISEAESKPTHLITPGCAHRVEKFWLPGGGVGGVPGTGVTVVTVVDAGVAELAVPPPQAESTEAITGTSSKLFLRDMGNPHSLTSTAKT